MRMNDLLSGKLAERIKNLPPLPATVAAVIEVTSNPDSSAKELMQAILPDPIMCSTLLKVANSAFFGQSRQVATLEKAIVVLGFDEIRNIILSKAIFTSFASLARTRNTQIPTFWKHSFLCGLTSKIIAEDTGYLPSELFIAGLLHDIGKLILLMAFPEDCQLLTPVDQANLFHKPVHEKERYGISHDFAGHLLLRRWMLPEQLLMAAGYHHAPEEAPEHKEHALIVQLADLLSLLYLSNQNYRPQEVAELIPDICAYPQELWKQAGLPWTRSGICSWYEQLAESHRRHGGIFDILSS